MQEMHSHLAGVEEGVKCAILATTLGIELKPAQVGLKVQGRELKLAWAQLLATLVGGQETTAYPERVALSHGRIQQSLFERRPHILQRVQHFTTAVTSGYITANPS